MLIMYWTTINTLLTCKPSILYIRPLSYTGESMIGVRVLRLVIITRVLVNTTARNTAYYFKWYKSSSL